MITVFDSAEIAVPERLGALREITSASLMPTAIHSPDPAAVTASVGTVPLGNAQVWSLDYRAVSARRTPREIRRSDPEYYQMALVRVGRQGIEQGSTSALVRRGDLVLYDSSRPYEAVTANAAEPTETVVLHFPKEMLPLPADQVAGLAAVALPGTVGIGHLLAGYLGSLADSRTGFTGRDALRLESITADLVTALLAHHLDRTNPPLRSHTGTLYLRIMAFIDEHLHDPELRPARIAAAYRISPRYLHRIFQQHHPVGVATHIRSCRLDRARRDLADRRLDHLTVAAISRRWGFINPAEFGRAFRRHTGISPRDHRNNT